MALLFALLALLMALAAGCGGDDRSGSRQQENGETVQQGEGQPGIKIAPGTVESVDPEAVTLVLQVTGARR
jgi:hypothetical protein